MDADLFYSGCSCHMGHPPCSFCTSMSDEEASAYWTGGRTSLLAFIGRMTDADYELVNFKVEEIGSKPCEACDSTLSPVRRLVP